MPSVGFEPSIPASERLPTYALDRTATGIGLNHTYLLRISRYVWFRLSAIIYLIPTVRWYVKIFKFHLVEGQRISLRAPLCPVFTDNKIHHHSAGFRRLSTVIQRKVSSPSFIYHLLHFVVSHFPLFPQKFNSSCVLFQIRSVMF